VSEIKDIMALNTKPIRFSSSFTFINHSDFLHFSAAGHFRQQFTEKLRCSYSSLRTTLTTNVGFFCCLWKWCLLFVLYLMI